MTTELWILILSVQFLVEKLRRRTRVGRVEEIVPVEVDTEDESAGQLEQLSISDVARIDIRDANPWRYRAIVVDPPDPCDEGSGKVEIGDIERRRVRRNLFGVFDAGCAQIIRAVDAQPLGICAGCPRSEPGQEAVGRAKTRDSRRDVERSKRRRRSEGWIETRYVQCGWTRHSTRTEYRHRLSRNEKPLADGQREAGHENGGRGRADTARGRVSRTAAEAACDREHCDQRQDHQALTEPESEPFTKHGINTSTHGLESCREVCREPAPRVNRAGSLPARRNAL